MAAMCEIAESYLKRNTQEDKLPSVHHVAATKSGSPSRLVDKTHGVPYSKDVAGQFDLLKVVLARRLRFEVAARRKPQRTAKGLHRGRGVGLEGPA